MKLFHLPRHNSRSLDQETAWQRFFRYIIIALLFSGVILGFWLQQERREGQIKRTTSAIPSDLAGGGDESQQEQLAEYARKFRETYGLNLFIHVINAPLPQNFLTPEEKAGNVLLVLSPQYEQVQFELPPIAEAALGATFVEYLRRTHFAPYFKANSWQEGLAAALNMLSQRFDEAQTAKRNGSRP